jgi:hypothetical protein
MRTACVLAILLAGLALSPPATADPDAEAAARAAFEANIARGHRYDSAAAEFYADEATIRNVRRYPTGQAREMMLTGTQYKELIRTAMPAAKARGDRSDYRSCRYTVAGEAVRVECERYSHLKQYTSPYRALLKKAPSGAWLVYDEDSESRP